MKCSGCVLLQITTAWSERPKAEETPMGSLSCSFSGLPPHHWLLHPAFQQNMVSLGDGEKYKYGVLSPVRYQSSIPYSQDMKDSAFSTQMRASIVQCSVWDTFDRAASPVRHPMRSTAVTARLTMTKALSGMYPHDAERRAMATCSMTSIRPCFTMPFQMHLSHNSRGSHEYCKLRLRRFYQNNNW